jgi:predicted transposase YdaD
VADNPHDALFKWTFSDPVRAAAEFRAVLPPEIQQVVDLSTLELCPGEFVDEELRHSYSDLLFQARIADSTSFVYLLFEHQSSPDELMPLRLLAYLLRILELQLRNRRERQEPVLPLPIVIPVVLHHSEQGWTRATRFEQLFDPILLAIPALAAVVPRFGFLLDDISQVSDGTLRLRALDRVSGLTLWALRDARSPADIVLTLQQWLWAMRELVSAPHGVEALRIILRYITAVTEDTAAEQVLQIVAKAIPHEEVMTLAERWKAEGEAKGRAEGEAKGRAEGEARGRLDGQRALLLRQLAMKFGEPPPAMIERVTGADEATLARWSQAILSAESLEQVFAEPG